MTPLMTLGLLAGAGGVAAVVAPAAAHADTTQWYEDVTAHQVCWDVCGAHDFVLAASNNLVELNATGGTVWTVSFNGNGYWCFNDGNGYLGITGTDALIDNYSSSCNVGGDEWQIHCSGTQYEFWLSNVHNGDYVDYNSAGVYHANTGPNGDTFIDNAHIECA